MIPEKFASHCKTIKATVDLSTFGPRQKKNIYNMVKTGKFGSRWNESPTTIIAKNIYQETKQPYFQIQGDEIAMYYIPSTHPVFDALKSYYALCKLLPQDSTNWHSDKSIRLYDKIEELQKAGETITCEGYWDGFRIDLHQKYGEPEPLEFKAIVKKIKDMAVLEHPDDAPAVIKAQQIIDGEITEMTFNYVT